MPELPEVETIKQILEPKICGRKIIKLIVNKPDVLARPSLERFKCNVDNTSINAMGRRGKYLMIYLNNGATILIHLRMTGQLVCVPSDYQERPHTHVIFRFDNEQELRYIDVRRLGHIWLKSCNEEDKFSGIQNLGVEPFDNKFDSSYIQDKLGKRKIAVKQGLLDQTVVAGLGNIYTDEALFEAGIHPARRTDGIEIFEWNNLIGAIQLVLKRSIEQSRMTAEEYLAGEGKEYRSTSFLKVYGKEGQTCSNCNSVIERIKIVGRSSCFCPHCQPLEAKHE